MGLDVTQLRNLIFATVVVGTSFGCVSMSNRPVSQQKPRVNQDDKEFADRFLAHWNQNAEQINSVVCRTVDVSGHSEGQSYTLDAMLAFQEPSNFRLTGKFLGKSEADLGSNENEVWFWMARAQPPAVYFCKRQDLANVSLPMPFHPDDLIEVLGSVPLDPKHFQFDHGYDQYVTVVSTETAPSGDPVVKRIVIDRNTGRAAKFEIWEKSGEQPRKLAEARILNYYDDPSGVFVPQKVQLVFPDAKTDLTIVMRSRAIEINQIDKQWAVNLFSRGNYLNSQVVDLGEEYRRRQASLNHRQFAAVSKPQQVSYNRPQSAELQQPVSLSAQPAIVQEQEPEHRIEQVITATEGVPDPFAGIQPGGYRRNSNSTPGATLTDQILNAGSE